jgi:hypothetical protein
MWGVMLPWNSYADAEELDAVHIGEIADVDVHADSQRLAVENLHSSALVEADDTESGSINTDPGLSDVVHLETSKGDQDSQLDLAGSRDMRSLDVVDTDSSVKLPHAVADIGEGIDDQKASVDLGDGSMAASIDVVDQGGQLEAESNEMNEQADQPLVTGTSVKLPVTSIADGQGQVGGTEGQLKDVSSDAVSEESTGLPYAVVLALLALIGLVPVARRNDHYRV